MKNLYSVFKIFLRSFLSLFTNIDYLKNLIRHISSFKYIGNKNNLRIIDPKDLFPGLYDNDIVLRKLDLQFGNMGHNEICLFTYLIKYVKPKNIFEFGTFNGLTALQIALNTEQEAKIFTLNLPSSNTQTKHRIGDTKEEFTFPDVQPGNLFRNNKLEDKISQLFGDSANFDYKEFYNKMDFVFVDASHEYEYVKNDTEAAFRMLSDYGIILWHDYPNSSGVKKYLEEQASDFDIYQIKDTHFAIHRKNIK